MPSNGAAEKKTLDVGMDSEQTGQGNEMRGGESLGPGVCAWYNAQMTPKEGAFEWREHGERLGGGGKGIVCLGGSRNLEHSARRLRGRTSVICGDKNILEGCEDMRGRIWVAGA
jgi:hypothetical protein